MPTPHVSHEQMKSGRKHWTKDEQESRERAESEMKRSTVRLSKPVWLSDDACRIWKRVRRQAGEIGIIDNIDAEMLGVYCDAIAQYGALTKIVSGPMVDPDFQEHVKMLQSWARLIAQYADKLGFSPAARARLAKKRADKKQDDFGGEFD